MRRTTATSLATVSSWCCSSGDDPGATDTCAGGRKGAGCRRAASCVGIGSEVLKASSAARSELEGQKLVLTTGDNFSMNFSSL